MESLLVTFGKGAQTSHHQPCAISCPRLRRTAHCALVIALRGSINTHPQFKGLLKSMFSFYFLFSFSVFLLPLLHQLDKENKRLMIEKLLNLLGGDE